MKLAPIIRMTKTLQGQGRDITYTLVYTGRDDDPSLEGTIFSDLSIERPSVFLGVDCENLNELTGQVMSEFERYLRNHKTDVVIVVDDLASTMAAAIVTKKQGVLLAHIAAGTRSFDITMPKEINRLVIDGLSDILFTAGISNNSIANREGAELSKVYMVGNILIDNQRLLHDRFVRPDELAELGIEDGKYIVFTLNRRALMADTAHLGALLEAMISASKGTPIVAPLRENAVAVVKKALQEKGITAENLHFIAPQDYLHFAYLTAHALGIVTDSGNVAEEATFNQVPCITLNSYTEHIETVKVGSNELVGEDPEQLNATISKLIAGQWKSSAIPDRWDGRSGERILQTLITACAGK